MSRSAIQAAIPHRAPFLFLDEIVERGDKHIVCRKQFNGDEWFFAGHFPQQPIVPGVLLCEAALQAGAVLVSGNNSSEKQGLPMVTRISDVRFKHPVHPGDTIDIHVELRDQLGGASYFNGKITCAGKESVRLEFACMLANPNSEP